MNIKVKINSMKEAEHFSAAIREFPYDISLRADRFCVDPKSTLGVLAMMYSSRDNMYLDTGDMEDKEIPKLTRRIEGFIHQSNEH